MENSHLGSLTTERRNERSRRIHQSKTIDILKIINDEDKTVAEAVQEVLPEVKTAVDFAVGSLKKGDGSSTSVPVQAGDSAYSMQLNARRRSAYLSSRSLASLQEEKKLCTKPWKALKITRHSADGIYQPLTSQTMIP
ncbi:hypothetical protein RSC3_00080 [Bacillus paralicheniformis]|nr:hypothetical protein RSC3_00080 [Bacillus paralicheniformis]